MNNQNCNQCENNCPVDALKCGRGRRLFGVEASEGRNFSGSRGTHGPRFEKTDNPVLLLRQCGHMLHHGAIGGDDLLSALNEDEKKELTRLLTALVNDWQSHISE